MITQEQLDDLVAVEKQLSEQLQAIEAKISSLVPEFESRIKKIRDDADANQKAVQAEFEVVSTKLRETLKPTIEMKKSKEQEIIGFTVTGRNPTVLDIISLIKLVSA